MVKKIRHGVNEDAAGFPPRRRHTEPLRPHADGEGVAAVFLGVHDRQARAVGPCQQPPRQPLRIAMITSGRHARASRGRVPRSVGPLDGASVGHISSLGGWPTMSRKLTCSVFLRQVFRNPRWCTACVRAQGRSASVVSLTHDAPVVECNIQTTRPRRGLSSARSSSPPMSTCTTGPRSSPATRSSPPRFSTACCTTYTSSTSTAAATDSERPTASSGRQPRSRARR